MTPELKKFIQENRDLINQNSKESWEEIYKQIPEYSSLGGEFTRAILDSGINDPAEIMGYIPDNYFCDCDKYREYSIPEYTISIGRRAFEDCDNFRTLKIPPHVVNISRSAFTGCTFLINLTIPDSVETIEPFAFSHCYNLTRVTIGDNLKTLGDCAFWNCPNLKYITINSTSLTSIGEDIFGRCPKLKEIHYNSSMNPELLKLKGNRKALKIICTDGVY